MFLKGSVPEIRQNIHLLMHQVIHEFPLMTGNMVEDLWITLCFPFQVQIIWHYQECCLCETTKGDATWLV